MGLHSFVVESLVPTMTYAYASLKRTPPVISIIDTELVIAEGAAHCGI